ncbi:MAG: pyruvate formate lyase-activating protein [Clostridia bacterium]|nr:pyruvate formate lyase-activating protein [Clostridia bacterium]
MTGYIHSVQSLGTVDGPGVRCVVFASGCPYRCIYCHNPDTWELGGGTLTDCDELVERIMRLYPYIKDGGVTLSGGEPCMQAEFFISLTEKLQQKGLHVALDTSGAVTNDSALELASMCDLVLLDVKFTTDEGYKRYTGGSIDGVMKLLMLREEIEKPTYIRQVIVPGINDKEDDIIALRELLSPYKTVEKIELLPFKKLCLEKYESLGIPFPLRDTPEMDRSRLAELEKLLG